MRLMLLTNDIPQRHVVKTKGIRKFVDKISYAIDITSRYSLASRKTEKACWSTLRTLLLYALSKRANFYLFKYIFKYP